MSVSLWFKSQDHVNLWVFIKLKVRLCWTTNVHRLQRWEVSLLDVVLQYVLVKFYTQISKHSGDIYKKINILLGVSRQTTCHDVFWSVCWRTPPPQCHVSSAESPEESCLKTSSPESITARPTPGTIHHHLHHHHVCVCACRELFFFSHVHKVKLEAAG